MLSCIKMHIKPCSHRIKYNSYIFSTKRLLKIYFIFLWVYYLIPGNLNSSSLSSAACQLALFSIYIFILFCIALFLLFYFYMYCFYIHLFIYLVGLGFFFNVFFLYFLFFTMVGYQMVGYQNVSTPDGGCVSIVCFYANISSIWGLYCHRLCQCSNFLNTSFPSFKLSNYI